MRNERRCVLDTASCNAEVVRNETGLLGSMPLRWLCLISTGLQIPKALIQQNGSISDELRLLKSLRGIPLVVQFYCSMDDSNYQYLVVEFCQGGELFEV